MTKEYNSALKHTSSQDLELNWVQWAIWKVIKSTNSGVVVRSISLPLMSCAMLGKLCDPSRLKLPHLWNGNHNSNQLNGFSCRWHKLIHAKHSTQNHVLLSSLLKSLSSSLDTYYINARLLRLTSVHMKHVPGWTHDPVYVGDVHTLQSIYEVSCESLQWPGFVLKCPYKIFAYSCYSLTFLPAQQSRLEESLHWCPPSNPCLAPAHVTVLEKGQNAA